MFEIGTQVVYGIHGVCQVTGIERQEAGEKALNYLVLEPLQSTGSRFLIPTHNAAAMSKLQKVLTKEALEQLLCSAEVHTYCWIEEESRRKQIYRELIGSGDRVQLMAMVYTLYQHKVKQTANGRKVHQCDENFLRDAEKNLISEIAAVMEMDQMEAKRYIRSHLQK